MTLFLIKVEVSGLMSSVGRREWPMISRAGWIAVGNYWLDKIRPRHFTLKGQMMYRYEQRTAKYMKRKLRTHGHGDPLVWTGRSRARSALGQVKATRSGVRVSMNVPMLNIRPRGKRDSMRDELTRVLSGEKKELGREYERVVVSWINRLRGRGRERLAS